MKRAVLVLGCALACTRMAVRIAALVAMLIGANAARAQLLPSQAAGAARSQVAMLEVNGTVAAGVIVGFDADAIYVATAAHVTNLTDRPLPKVGVKFEDAPDVSRPGEFLERFEAQEIGDLAVVVVKRDSSLRAFLDGLDFAMLSPVPLPPADTPVTSIGYSAGSPWTKGVKETLLPMERGNLRITSEVIEGQSGGAVYNEAWELIGMVTYRDVAGPIIYARPIASVVSSLQRWEVPVRLVARPAAARVKGADEVARENERRAQRALRRNLSLRLAAQSDQARPSSSVRSLLLAAEALNATRQDGIATSAAREAMAKSLGSVGGVGLSGHAETVFSATFNSDDSLLATASRDGVIRVWNLADPRVPRCIKILMEPGQGNYIVWESIAFDKQSRALITLAQSGHSLGGREHLASPKIWALDTPDISPAPGWLLEDHAPSSAMVASHKGNLIAVAGARNHLTLYSIAQKPSKVQRTLSIPPGYEIRHLVFSRDDNVLIGGTADARVVIWNLRSGNGVPRAAFDTGHAIRGPFKDDNRPTLDLLDISDDHAFLVTGSSQWDMEGRFGDPSLRIWRLDGLAPTGLPWVVDQTREEGNKFIRDAFFYEKSHLVVGVTPSGSLSVWDPVRGHFDGTPGDDAPASRVQGGKYVTGAIHSRNRGLLTLSREKSIDILQTRSLRNSHSEEAIHLSGLDSSVEVMALSDSERFLFGGLIGGEARLWDLRRSDPLEPPSSLAPNPYSQVRAIQLSDSGRLAITLRGTSLEFWDIQKPEEPRILYAQEIDLEQFGDCVVCHVVLSGDERWVAVQDRDEKRSLVIEIGAGSGVRRHFPVASRTWRNTDEIVFSPDSRFLFVEEDNGVRVVYDLRAKSPKRDIVTDSESYLTPIFSSDGKWICFRLFVNEYRDLVGRERVVGFVASTDAVRDKKKRFPISGFATSIGEAVFSPDGQLLALSGEKNLSEREGDDRRVQVLRLIGDTWKKEAELEPIEYAARALRFSPDSHWLLTGSSDITIGDRNVTARIWNLREPLTATSGQRLPNVIWNLKLATFSPDSLWLITVSGADPYARLWALRGNKLKFVSRLVGPQPRLNNHWSAVFSPDSKAVVLRTIDDATPFYWRLSEERIVEAGNALPNGDREIEDLQISADGRALTILNSGETATGTSGTEGSHVTYVDLTVFPADDSYAILPASANARSHVYRDDLGVVISAGESLMISIVDPGIAMRRSAEVVGRNMTWDEWVKARIAGPYRPTYLSASVGADVIENETRNFARMVKERRGSEADELKRDLLAWARQLGHAGACNSLAWELAVQGDATNSLDMVACALRLVPDDPQYHDTRGVALVLSGRKQEAVAEFEYFVEHARGIDRFAGLIPIRVKWIQRLKVGQEPFATEE